MTIEPKTQHVATRVVMSALWFCVCNFLATGLAAQCANPTQVADQTISSGSFSFQDNNALSANSVVINGSASVTFVAGKCIQLLPGFRATAGTAGTTFHAWVDTVPTALSVSPSSGTGSPNVPQQFTWVTSSPSGYGYLTDVYLLFSPSLLGQGACYIRYNQPSNVLYLADGSGVWWLPGLIPQTTGSASNSVCAIDSSRSSVSGSGVQLAVTVSVTFLSPVTSTMGIYSLATDSTGLSSEWQQLGTWVDPPYGPAITSLTPSGGPVGTQVTISGSNFGQSPGQVTFNGAANLSRVNAVTSQAGWSDSSITIDVPSQAASGPVYVIVNGIYSNAVSFTVGSFPVITGVSPTVGAVGSVVTLTGANFGTSQSSSTVTFNGVNAQASVWNSSSITVTVPQGASTGNLAVTVGGVSSNGIAFTVSNGPWITSLSPMSGPPGTPVTITGANFGAGKGSSIVTFNGLTAGTVPLWSASSITTAVPAGATTGAVLVQVGGVLSNGVNFTVEGPVPSKEYIYLGSRVIATESPLSISGQISDGNGVGLAGVTVTLSGPINATTITTGNGSYAFTNLVPGRYVVTPSLPGYTPVTLDVGHTSVYQVFAPATAGANYAHLYVAGTGFNTYDTYTLELSTNQPNTSFTLCQFISGASNGCTANFGRTDGNGNWTSTGMFAPGSAGNWDIWVRFPSLDSNQIYFTVSDVAIYTLFPSPYLYNVGDPWSIILTSSLPNTSFTLCGIYPSNSVSCTPNWGLTDFYGNWTSNGYFAQSEVGSWQEWITIPTAPTSLPIVTTNTIYFTVNP